MKKSILYICLMLSLVSCNSGFLKEYSQDLTRVTTFADLDEIVVGEAFLAPGMAQNATYYVNLYNTNFLPLHFMSDELEENLEASSDPDQYALGYRKLMFPYFTWQQNVNLDYEKKNTQSSQEQSYWNLAYTHIAACNMIIAEAQRLKADTEEDVALSNRINGEVYFLRALYYYTLVNLYAKPYAPSTASSTPGVPLKLSEYVEDKDFQRNSLQEVYSQIVSDLSQAELYLKDMHSPSSIHRVGINAVYLLRSRVALYMQDWAVAKQYAELSLAENSDLQALDGLAEGLYPLNGNSSENIFAMGGATLGYTLFLHPGGTYYGTPYAPTYQVSDHLYGLYADNDARKSLYFSTQYTEGRVPYLTKIDYTDNSLSSYSDVSDQFLFRTAEAYLNVAEACAELGEDQKAVQYVQSLRSKRVLNDEAINLSGAELIRFIRQERERELCFEGQRWYDMRRYAVDEKCPEVETVRHTFTSYVYKNYTYTPASTTVYELKTNDGGMVLDIPKDVRDFQNSIGANERPAREVVDTKVYN